MDASTIFKALSLGLGVWFFTWGMNRIYLLFKSIVS